MKPALNKWQAFLTVRQNAHRFDPFHKTLSVGIIKFVRLPDEGAMVSRKDHKGIALRFDFFWPFADISFF